VTIEVYSWSSFFFRGEPAFQDRCELHVELFFDPPRVKKDLLFFATEIPLKFKSRHLHAAIGVSALRFLTRFP